MNGSECDGKAGFPVMASLLAQEEPLDPNRWVEEIGAYTAADAASPPPHNAVVFTGSSSIALWKTLDADMNPLTVINRGFGGSTMQDLLYWLETLVLKYQPRAVVLYEGDNDIGYANATAEEVFAAFKEFVARIQPKARIYVMSIKPSILRWNLWPEMRKTNGLIRKFCENRDGIQYIDVASSMLDERGQPRTDIFEADGLHMNGKCYELWTSIVRPTLLRFESAYEKNSALHRE